MVTALGGWAAAAAAVLPASIETSTAADDTGISVRSALATGESRHV